MESNTDPKSVKAISLKREQDHGLFKLGVLFVHGIGTQRRGDTLLQAGETLHRWLRKSGIDVELVDADVSPSTSDPQTPANAVLVFHAKDQAPPTKWLLAECHWAEVFRPSSFRELFSWSWRIVPWAVLLHLVPRYRQVWEFSEALQAALKKRMVFKQTLRMFRRYVGRDPKLVDGLISRTDLLLISLRAIATIFAFGFQAMFLSVLGAVVLVILSLVLLLSLLLPIDSVRQFALKVQLRLSATIGDSSAYLSSPLIASAIIAKLHNDLNWLAPPCDQVVIVAHSQGAAVAYDTVHGWPWKGGPEQKLTKLITYGSGLRKLFDLRAAQQHPVQWTVLGLLAFIFCLLLVGLTVFVLSAPSVLAAGGLMIAALFTSFLFAGIVGAGSELAHDDPELLDPESGGPEWDDFFSSHDPVPNGPVAVSANKNSLLPGFKQQDVINRFYKRQREVTNRRSSLSDHTSYWDSTDDFVAWVATRLLELAGGRQVGVVRAWIALSAERRRWRVQIRNGLRWVTVFLGVMAVLTYWRSSSTAEATRVVLEQSSIQPLGVTTWIIPKVSLPEWGFQTLWTLVAIMLAYLIAYVGTALWERRERNLFFAKKGYELSLPFIALISTGWVLIITSLPVAAAVLKANDANMFVNSLWPALAGLVFSALVVWRRRSPPGVPEQWGLQLLKIGENLLLRVNADREDLEEAKMALEWSYEILGPLRHKDSERASRCLADARQRLSDVAQTAS